MRQNKISHKIKNSSKHWFIMPNSVKQLVGNCNAVTLWLVVGVKLLMILGLSACSTAATVAPAGSHFQISGNASAGVLSIDRIQLDFGSGESSITIAQNSEIKPVATIRYKGLGNFSARWVLDGQVIGQYNTTLNRGSLLAFSPEPATPIPTFNLGRHQLRLEIVQPLVKFKQPSINFFVVAQ